MTDIEAAEVLGKLPDAIYVLSGNLATAAFYINSVNKFLMNKGIYNDFVNYLEKLTKEKEVTIN